MPAPPSQPIVRRVFSTREAMLAAGLDALIVTHLPNLRYLTGFSGSAGAAIITRSTCTLIVDFRYVTVVRALVDRADTDALQFLQAEASYDETIVRVLQSERVQRIGIEAAWMPVSRFNHLSRLLAPAHGGGLTEQAGCPALVPTERMIERGRIVKDPVEIATLREGARRLSAVARILPALARAGRAEIDVASDVEAAMRREGFERPAFATIVASGPNGALPHARPGARVLCDGDGVVLDFGGVYDGYCVDLTRTIQLGTCAPEFRRIFAAVAEAHAAALAAVRPGLPATAVDRAARAVLERHGLGDAFGHGTGHGLGLEVHEEPRIAKPGSGLPDVTLEPGMVFTIEPGAYVEGLGGVRIEDDVLVTAGGCEILTDAPVEM
jgi:Xaa-Pro aminopeptidase